MENPAEEAPKENLEKGTEEKVLLKWRALERPFKERDQSWFTTVAVIVVLASFVALFLKEFLLLGVIFAITFVSYLLATKQPDFIVHKLTAEGISSGEKFYAWEDLENFWFKSLGGEDALVVTLKKGFPSQLFLLLGDMQEDEVKQFLTDHLEYVPAPGEDWMEKSAHWFSEKVGLD
jgi:hypothetical protein